MATFVLQATSDEANPERLLIVKIDLFTIPESKTYTVTFILPEDKVSLQISESEFILDALLEAGYPSPFMCRQGYCLSCASKLMEGEVDMSSARRYYEKDYKAGFILICSAKPKSDLVIETAVKKQMVNHRIEQELPAPRG